jgi:hypothetical protein
VPASVRERLQQRSRARKEDYQLVLAHYAMERLLYRLSRSEYRDLFVLKGALLFRLWSDKPHRPTRDLDLLGRGEISVARFEQVFRDVCGQPVEEDGLAFDAATIRGQPMKEDQDYQGVRLSLTCRLLNIRIPVNIDIGTGDAITPAPAEVTYPAMLEFPAPSLLAYPRETVVAEKYQAMVMLGITNSRMKDFYDLWVLARQFPFEGPALARAIEATFRRRQTPLPAEAPLALTAAFYEERTKLEQWRAFLTKSKLAGGTGLDQVATVLRAFLLPPTEALVAGAPFEAAWPAGGPWPAAGPAPG